MKPHKISLPRQATAAATVFAFACRVLANPTGLTVQQGSAALSASGSQLTVTAGNNAVLNWQSFNIAAGERTVFNQPSAASVVWNRINNNQGASQIYGSLQANGVVVLLNSSGFYFGPNSFVSAAGLVVSTANCTPSQNFGGGWEFNGPPPLASIVNYGSIKVGNGGSCYFIADKIENHGNVEAPGGSIGFAAGQTVLLSERPDGRGMTMNVTLPRGSVDNYGNVIADGGTIALHAKVVNQNGFIQANSVREQNGTIELVAADDLELGANSQILAQGGSSASGSAGGNVTLKSGNIFGDSAGSTISTAGGANGGNGGNIEVSAPNIRSLDSAMDAHAAAGFAGGELLLDPVNIVLGTAGAGTVPANGSVLSTDNGNGAVAGTLSLNVNTAFLNKNFSSILLQASGNIYLGNGTVNKSTGTFTFSASPAVTWNLGNSTGKGSGQLTLQAGGDIIFGGSKSGTTVTGSKIIDGGAWSVTLEAGYSFANSALTVGSGNLYLNGGSGKAFNGAVQLGSGTLQLLAGNSIQIGGGYAITTAGGSIYAHALKGDINTGSDAQGYHFNTAGATSLANAYDVNGGVGQVTLGGISTAAGGDVTLIAGGNIMSVLPAADTKSGKTFYYGGKTMAASSDDYLTAGSGAYGRQQAGNVTIVAHGNVTGNYMLANGTGNIYAGVLMDAGGNPIAKASGGYQLGTSGSAGTGAVIGSSLAANFALGLITGGWNVFAGQNIGLQEVRNPNGFFDIQSGSPWGHKFDYAADAHVSLNAGNQVLLGSDYSTLPRLDPMPFIYPSILNISAGVGGVVLHGDYGALELILFPSKQGSLTINTAQGGSMAGQVPANSSGAPQLFNLIVSDSGLAQYLPSSDNNNDPFGLNDHADTPVHQNNPTAVQLNISGDIKSVYFGSPEAAQINVVGNIGDCRFQIMNLNATDVTSINVGQSAKIGMENSGILNAATDGNLVVGGDILNRSAFTSVDLTAASQQAGWRDPNLSLLSQAVDNTITPAGSSTSTSVSATALASSFYYDAQSHVLTYQNISGLALSDVLNLLGNLKIQVFQNGVPLWQDADHTIRVTQTVSIFDAVTAQALLQQYNDLGGAAPAASFGYNNGWTIGGGGKLAVSARNIDLGSTAGLQSVGVGLYSVGGVFPLAKTFTKGADISLDLSGNLDMQSTSIASVNGGKISIRAAGDVNVGSGLNITSGFARGIYSTSLGHVSVIAEGNVNVNGSRIAAYDGGNVTVESLNGNVNAGTGGAGYVVLSAFYVDPKTRLVYSDSPTIPGSGILATTFPARGANYPAPDFTIGNILVEAPNGDVNANAGGVIQLPLNSANAPNSIVEILAGYELRDAQGNPVNAANIASGKPVQVSSGRNIDASGSGVIGNDVALQASGSIQGIIFARQNIDLNAQQNVNVTALAQGNISANAGGSISGTLAGIGGVNASGGSVDATVLSQNASVNGQSSGSTFAQGTAANAASQGMAATDTAKPAQNSSTTDGEDLNKKKKGISLAQKVGRVTVVLPAAKKVSAAGTQEPKL